MTRIFIGVFRRTDGELKHCTAS